MEVMVANRTRTDSHKFKVQYPGRHQRVVADHPHATHDATMHEGAAVLFLTSRDSESKAADACIQSCLLTTAATWATGDESELRIAAVLITATLSAPQRSTTPVNCAGHVLRGHEPGRQRAERAAAHGQSAGRQRPVRRRQGGRPPEECHLGKRRQERHEGHWQVADDGQARVDCYLSFSGNTAHAAAVPLCSETAQSARRRAKLAWQIIPAAAA